MSFNKNYIAEFIKKILPDRTNVQVHGQHPELSNWIAWYQGKTKWHSYLVRKNKKKRTVIRKSLCAAKMYAEDWASNYANENTQISIAKKNDNKIVQEILDYNKVLSKFNGFAEQFNALGIAGAVVMPSKFNVDTETNAILKSDNAKVKISFINAERVIPITLFDGECTECAFLKYGTKTCVIQVHLLVDGYYWIAEVKGDNTGLTNANEFNFDYTKIKLLKTTSKVPLFKLWHPNIVDNINLDNPLGASIYANAIDTLKSIDIAYDSLYREFKNSAKKRFVSADLQYIDESGDLDTVTLEDEEMFVPQGADAKTLIQEFNGEIRVESFISGLNFQINLGAKKCGLGTNRYEFNSTGGRPLQTATAVIAKESELYRNVIKQENFATDAFKEMLLAIKYVNNTFTNNPELTFESKDIEITYDDNIVEDTDSRKKQELSEVQTGTMSIAEYRTNWYGEDIKTATKFLQENAMLVNTYLPALQAGAMSPEIFVNLVYGESVKNREELIAYITDKMSAPANLDIANYDDENSNNTNEDDTDKEKDNPEKDVDA